MSIFKSCDIRGLYQSELTPAFAVDLGRAIGTELDGGRVVVGGDARPSTPRLKGALLEGLISAGCYGVDLGLVPTPTLYFAQEWLEADGAVMVTASHNPPGYNGFKLQLGSLPISEAQLAALRRRIVGRSFREGEGYWNRADGLTPYQTHLEQFFANDSFASAQAGRSLRVVVDAGNGCLSELAPAMLRRRGHTVIERYCEIDGRFPYRDPNPAVEAHLADLVARVRAERADLGVAYDGDGDRVVFVDDQGRVLPGDRVLVLFIRRRLPAARTPGERTVVYDIKCSSVVAEEIERWQGIPAVERSGHAFIKTTLQRQQAGLAGEISGHYFFGELQRDDALYATLLMLQILAAGDRPLSAVMDEIPRYPITPDLRLPCSPEMQRSILAELQTAFAGQPVSTIDGVRIAFDNGWALVRSSVTEPLLTARFEGRTSTDLAQIQAELARRVPALGALLRTSGQNSG